MVMVKYTCTQCKLLLEAVQSDLGNFLAKPCLRANQQMTIMLDKYLSVHFHAEQVFQSPWSMSNKKAI